MTNALDSAPPPGSLHDNRALSILVLPARHRILEARTPLMPDTRAGQRWHIFQRWQEYHGERRAALMRLLAIIGFYGVELLHYHGLALGPLELAPPEYLTRDFHAAVTSIAVCWAIVGVGVLLCLRNRVFPRWLKYAVTALDVILLTGVLILASGPRSPAVSAYFVIIALAALRMSLPLVRCATIGAMAAYLYLNGFATWFTDRPIDVPRYQQLIVLVALGLSGIIMGQVVRGVREGWSSARDSEARP